MSSLISLLSEQKTEGIIGREEYLKSLAEKDKVEILVTSDSHGCKTILSSVVKKLGDECDLICFCGDGIEEFIETIHDELKIAKNEKAFAFAQGNGDNSSCIFSVNRTNETRRTAKIFRTTKIIKIPQQVVFSVCGKNVFLTHGHIFDVYYTRDFLISEMKHKNAQVAFFGHTHVPTVETENNLTLINPGSCARPRNASPYSCAIVTIFKGAKNTECKFFDIKNGFRKFDCDSSFIRRI